ERLPGYAPELNPIEQAWGNVKSQELANLCADTIGEVSDAAQDGLHRIGSDAHLCFAFGRPFGCQTTGLRTAHEALCASVSPEGDTQRSCGKSLYQEATAVRTADQGEQGRIREG